MALIEGVVINLSQARREVDVGQGVAPLEGTRGDFGEALRQTDTPQGNTIEEGLPEELVHVADVRFLQGRASTECTGVQSPQCGREFNLSQRGASVEGSRMDAHDSLRQGDGGELPLIHEGTVADVRHGQTVERGGEDDVPGQLLLRPGYADALLTSGIVLELLPQPIDMLGHRRHSLSSQVGMSMRARVRKGAPSGRERKMWRAPG